MKTCAYPPCGTTIQPRSDYWRAKYCSRACSAADRSRQSRVEAGRKGGQISGAQKRQAAELRRTVHLGNERQRAYRLGFSAGYEQGYECAYQRIVGEGRIRT
jgi:general stress protein YciG